MLVVTIERFSFTTTILLQPYSFIRLHELVQGPILLTLFLVVSSFVLKEITCASRHSASRYWQSLWSARISMGLEKGGTR